MLASLPGVNHHIRDFIAIVMEAHEEPEATRPTLGQLAACFTEPIPVPSATEPLAVVPERYRAHQAGRLRRGAGGRHIWARIPGTSSWIGFPTAFEVRYLIEASGNYAAIVLQHVDTGPDMVLSRCWHEHTIDRLILTLGVIEILPIDRSDSLEALTS